MKKIPLEITAFYSNEDVEKCPTMKIPEYAFIGRSNVGKSSLINCILKSRVAFTSSKPGKTKLIHHIIINNNWALVDLPGYGYAKLSKTQRNNILKITNKYFKKRGIQLVCVFLLIDIRIPPQKNDLEKMIWLVENNIYFIRVFTKCEKLNQEKRRQMIQIHDEKLKQGNWKNVPETIISSAKKNIGNPEILKKIQELNILFQHI